MVVVVNGIIRWQVLHIAVLIHGRTVAVRHVRRRLVTRNIRFWISQRFRICYRALAVQTILLGAGPRLPMRSHKFHGSSASTAIQEVLPERGASLLLNGGRTVHIGRLRCGSSSKLAAGRFPAIFQILMSWALKWRNNECWWGSLAVGTRLRTYTFENLWIL